MAELIVSPLLQEVIDKLGSSLWKELRLLQGVKKDIEQLQSTLSTIKDVLEDAEQRSISDKPLCSWLKKLEDAAYDADDVMDEIQTEALQQRVENHGHPLKGQVRDFFSSHNHIAFRHRIALRIKDLLERLDEIANERINFHLTPRSVSVRPRHEETHSVVIASEVYGREEDKDMVLNFLLNENNDEDLSVLAIIGLGGVGKTTLAQLVYNDERIKSSFDLRGWVCVSDEFDVRGITRKIIQSINKEVCGDLELDPLGQLIRETLGEQRFILVLTHLDIYGCSGLSDMPPGMGRLTNLQAMSRFIVGEKDGCRITELKELNQIRGRLEIVNLQKVRNSMEAEEANLRAKVNVKQLELEWGGGENATETEVIESLHPPPNLEVLIIRYYPGGRLPSWMLMMMSGSTEPPTSLFRNLVRLELYFLRCEGLPSLGQLPFLEFLEIRGMDGVRRIGGEEFYGQPAEVGGGGGGRDHSVPFLPLDI